MSIRVGDKVRLLDEAFDVLPSQLSRQEMTTLLGTLTVKTVYPAIPCSDCPGGETSNLEFEGLEYTVPDFYVEVVNDG